MKAIIMWAPFSFSFGNKGQELTNEKSHQSVSRIRQCSKNLRLGRLTKRRVIKAAEAFGTIALMNCRIDFFGTTRKWMAGRPWNDSGLCHLLVLTFEEGWNGWKSIWFGHLLKKPLSGIYIYCWEDRCLDNQGMQFGSAHSFGRSLLQTSTHNLEVRVRESKIIIQPVHQTPSADLLYQHLILIIIYCTW